MASVAELQWRREVDAMLAAQGDQIITLRNLLRDAGSLEYKVAQWTKRLSRIERDVRSTWWAVYRIRRELREKFALDIPGNDPLSSEHDSPEVRAMFGDHLDATEQ